MIKNAHNKAENIMTNTIQQWKCCIQIFSMVRWVSMKAVKLLYSLKQKHKQFVCSLIAINGILCCRNLSLLFARQNQLLCDKAHFEMHSVFWRLLHQRCTDRIKTYMNKGQIFHPWHLLNVLQSFSHIMLFFFPCEKRQCVFRHDRTGPTAALCAWRGVMQLPFLLNSPLTAIDLLTLRFHKRGQQRLQWHAVITNSWLTRTSQETSQTSAGIIELCVCLASLWFVTLLNFLYCSQTGI